MTDTDLKIIIGWFLYGNTGISSKTICAHMLGLNAEYTDHPHDTHDRGRCIGLLKLMPEWIDRLDEMNQYKGWENQVELIKQELPE